MQSYYINRTFEPNFPTSPGTDVKHGIEMSGAFDPLTFAYGDDDDYQRSKSPARRYEVPNTWPEFEMTESRNAYMANDSRMDDYGANYRLANSRGVLHKHTGMPGGLKNNQNFNVQETYTPNHSTVRPTERQFHAQPPRQFLQRTVPGWTSAE